MLLKALLKFFLIAFIVVFLIVLGLVTLVRFPGEVLIFAGGLSLVYVFTRLSRVPL